ncbi:MAG: riboflavin biosynthesis protein RibF [Daejeonella sp.]|nr:riboflavin biosynthesis protein RibF [Daejeonella sp.]
MKIYNHIDEFQKLKNAVVTIGTFDGVHIGHQKIIARLQEVARQTGGETVILTFFPHPRMILHPEDVNIKLITTMKEKAELLEKLGIDHLLITPFTRDFSNLSPQEYIKNILVDKIGTSQIVMGYDHRFGKDREGGLEFLQKLGPVYGYQVEEIPEQDIHDIAVSSTKIRNSLLSGDVDMASDFLGHPFHLTGKVIKGDQIGRQLGYPTANLFIEETYKLIPSDGIYAVTVEMVEGSQLEVGSKEFEGTLQSKEDLESQITDERSPAMLLKSQTLDLKSQKKGMAYIGHRPTINGMSRNIEVNIFDFDADIYKQSIRLYFHHFIREDQKFSSLAELTLQLAKDEIDARDILEKLPN